MRLTKPQQLWVDALRSGKYTQDTGALEDVKGFCCLGVACKVAQENGVNVNLHQDDEYHGQLYGGHLSDQPDVMEWLGMNNHMGDIPSFPIKGDGLGTTNVMTLIELNDTNSCNFSQIADVVENFASDLFEDNTSGGPDVN